MYAKYYFINPRRIGTTYSLPIIHHTSPMSYSSSSSSTDSSGSQLMAFRTFSETSSVDIILGPSPPILRLNSTDRESCPTTNVEPNQYAEKCTDLVPDVKNRASRQRSKSLSSLCVGSRTEKEAEGLPEPEIASGIGFWKHLDLAYNDVAINANTVQDQDSEQVYNNTRKSEHSPLPDFTKYKKDVDHYSSDECFVTEFNDTVLDHPPGRSESPPLQPIPALYGPSDLPYARCPSGIDAFSFDDTDLDPSNLIEKPMSKPSPSRNKKNMRWKENEDNTRKQYLSSMSPTVSLEKSLNSPEESRKQSCSTTVPTEEASFGTKSHRIPSSFVRASSVLHESSNLNKTNSYHTKNHDKAPLPICFTRASAFVPPGPTTELSNSNTHRHYSKFTHALPDPPSLETILSSEAVTNDMRFQSGYQGCHLTNNSLPRQNTSSDGHLSRKSKPFRHHSRHTPIDFVSEIYTDHNETGEINNNVTSVRSMKRSPKGEVSKHLLCDRKNNSSSPLRDETIRQSTKSLTQFPGEGGVGIKGKPTNTTPNKFYRKHNSNKDQDETRQSTSKKPKHVIPLNNCSNTTSEPRPRK